MRYFLVHLNELSYIKFVVMVMGVGMADSLAFRSRCLVCTSLYFIIQSVNVTSNFHIAQLSVVATFILIKSKMGRFFQQNFDFCIGGWVANLFLKKHLPNLHLEVAQI